MRYVNKSILEADEVIIAHGCNAQGVMGSGVAKVLRDRWPMIFVDYKAELSRLVNHGKDPMGACILSPQDSDRKIIANLITQQNYGKDGKVYADLAAIQKSLIKLVAPTVMEMSMGGRTKKISVAIPKIGAGLGGLEWDDVVEILEDIEDAFEVEFVVYYV